MLSDSNHNCCIVPGSTQAGRDPKMGTTSVWKGINYKRLNQPLEYGRRRGLKTTHFFQFSERKMFSKGRYRRSEVKGHKHFTFMFVLLLLLRSQPKKSNIISKNLLFWQCFYVFLPFQVMSPADLHVPGACWSLTPGLWLITPNFSSARTGSYDSLSTNNTEICRISSDERVRVKTPCPQPTQEAVG